MLFYEPLFLFVFFPTFYLIYLLGGQREGFRRIVILCGSVLFYFWSEPIFVPVVLASSLLDHIIGNRITQGGPRRAKFLLAIGVLSNLAILIHYKYTRFLVENLNSLLHGFAVPPLGL